jgi:transposase
LNKETGEIVTYKEMCAAGGNVREEVAAHREPPLKPYFERDLEKDIVVCPMGQLLFYAGPGAPNGLKDVTLRRYHRASACKHCPNKCTMGKKRIISFKPDETQIAATFYDKCKTGKITRKANLTFTPIQLSPEERCWDAWVIVRYYPNQRRLRIRNRIVEHPYGTLKRWNGAYFLLTRGKLKVSAEMALSFLSYDFKRAVNRLGTQRLVALIRA